MLKRLLGLPDGDELFLTYFDRWYDPEARKRKRHRATRPDTVRVDGLKGLRSEDVSPLSEPAQEQVGKMVERMVGAARADWPDLLGVSGPVDLAWVDAFDRFHNRREVRALLRSSRPDDFTNDLLVRCCEFGAVLGHVLLATQPGLYWVYDWPYWESSVFDPQTGLVVAVFHWAVKKFSRYGVDDGFRTKLLACSEMIGAERQAQQPEVAS